MEWHRDNCLTLMVEREGWEEGMAMTWRGEHNEEVTKTKCNAALSRILGQLGNYSFVLFPLLLHTQITAKYNSMKQFGSYTHGVLFIYGAG